MSAGKIYGAKGNARVSKVLIAAALANVEVDFNPEFKFGVDNKKPEYLAKFPLGQCPGFESNDGSLLLTESNAIVFHFAQLQSSGALLGKTVADKAKVHQYAFYVETQVVPQILAIILPIWNIAPYNEQTEATAYTKFNAALDFLNKELNGKTYLVGDSITAADIILATGLQHAFAFLLEESHRAQYPNVTNYFTNFYSLPEVSKITGPINLAQTRVKYTPKA